MANIKTLSATYPILTFQTTLEPVWGDDAGRNTNSGKFSGTFVGYFTDIHIEVGPLTKSQMSSFKSIFEVPIVSLTYPDPNNNGSNKTETFYGTAITSLTDYWNGGYKPFSFDLKAVQKRNDV